MQLIDDALMNRLALEAEASARRRAIHRFHEHSEPVQRMLNALMEDSYVRPHRHAEPDKVELFAVLRGRLLVLVFGDEGQVLSHALLDAAGPVRGVDIPARTWHSLLALDGCAVALEIIQGPYEEATHKKFAPWAPEGTAEGLAWIRSVAEEVVPSAAQVQDR